MREVRLRVAAADVEAVLDRLLPLAPGGVREHERGRDTELVMLGDDPPGPQELRRLFAEVVRYVEEREVSDDPRERRAVDYEPELIGGRLVVRPEWAPRADPPPPVEVVLGEALAFGAGRHPTTRALLEQLLDLSPCGSFADLGCGSGVLAILAAKLGWNPVLAVDLEDHSVDATLANTALNDVAVRVTAADLTRDPVPVADGIAANVPTDVHLTLATRLPEQLPQVALLSGFAPDAAGEVLAAYAARGLHERRRIDAHAWTVAVTAR